MRAMQIKVHNSVENCATMFEGVQDVLGWRTGGEPTMLKDGTTTQKPEKMADILHNSLETRATQG